MPGLGGSQLEANITLAMESEKHCPPLWDSLNFWTDFWINAIFFGDWTYCFCNLMKLVYDPETGTTHDAKDIHVRTKIGRQNDTETVDYLYMGDTYDSEYMYGVSCTERGTMNGTSTVLKHKRRSKEQERLDCHS